MDLCTRLGMERDAAWLRGDLNLVREIEAEMTRRGFPLQPESAISHMPLETTVRARPRGRPRKQPLKES